MKKPLQLSLLLMVIGLLFFTTSCKPDKPELSTTTDESTVNFSFQTSVNSYPFYMDSIYNSEESQAYKYYFSVIKFYISDVYLIGDNDSVQLSDVELVDFNVYEPNISYKYKGKTGIYNKIKFGLGLNPIQNAGNPSNYDVGHPLGPAHGTFCGMPLMKYRFSIVEGRFDTTNVGNNFNRPFAVQTGDDENYKIVELYIDNLSLSKGVTKDINLDIDLHQLLFNAANPTDLKSEAVSHSDSPLGQAIQNNLAKAITVK